MSLPASVRAAVTEALGDLGTPTRSAAEIARWTPVGGGCINHGGRIDTEGGVSYFLKWNPQAPAGMFQDEAQGLAALGRALAEVDEAVQPRVPEPLAFSAADDGGPAWLLMEWIAPARGGGTRADRLLGSGLAGLHSVAPPTEEGFGWPMDNWIGSLPQPNDPSPSWPTFWRDRRIVPQLRRARTDGHLHESLFDDLIDAIPRALDGVETPSLLHGDLWSGNSYVAEDGTPVLVDPAVYRGDGEVDLAMTELFGGFGASLYDAYDDMRSITPEYRSHRRALYQLYYLLVHVNLFGDGYAAGCRRAAETVLAAVG